MKVRSSRCSCFTILISNEYVHCFSFTFPDVTFLLKLFNIDSFRNGKYAVGSMHRMKTVQGTPSGDLPNSVHQKRAKEEHRNVTEAKLVSGRTSVPTEMVTPTVTVTIWSGNRT